MPPLKSVEVRNFKCFRKPTQVTFGQATYLVGINNSGKTALLEALHCFFDSAAYRPDLLNKTELAARQEGYNRTDITVTFDLTPATGKQRKRRMLAAFGNDLAVTKSFTYREVSRTTVIEYSIDDEILDFENLDADVQSLLRAVAI
jgi:predicted ATP-dependent endonuclease of OLD family